MDSLDAPSGPIKVSSVLIVDDHADNRLILRFFLESFSEQKLFLPELILEAENGEQALTQVLAHNSPLIFMDLAMPVLDGFLSTKAIRRLQQEAGLSPSFIIAVSAFSSQDDQEKALAAGCNLFLPKPLKKSLLLTTIQSALAK